ncbi:MAG: guanylate kinase [Candidatus Omnitrophica bacterium]|nr:guanylate kinase [Candidatus Omnitrophota bacterium]
MRGRSPPPADPAKRDHPERVRTDESKGSLPTALSEPRRYGGASRRAARRGHLFVLSAPSGAGKTTLAEQLVRRDRRLARSVSVTTRAPRPGEHQGRDYHFVTRRQFQRYRSSQALLEWARVHGHWYGTRRAPIERALKAGRDILLTIDVQGAAQVKRRCPEAILLFVRPPDFATLRRRLVGRHTETPAAIVRRLRVARRELRCARWYDEAVVNDRLTVAVRRVRAIIRAARRRGTRT